MSGPNLLIGNGEVLSKTVPRDRSGGGKKNYPYSIQIARDLLGDALWGVVNATDELPTSAKPRSEGTSVVTIHPAFQAKTQMPIEVFRRAGLRAVGSKPAMVIPSKDVRKNAPSGEQPTAELYLSGTSDAFRKLHRMLMSDATGKGLQQEFRRLESIRPLTPVERIISIDDQEAIIPIEIVMHGEGADAELLDALATYAQECHCEVIRQKKLSVPGLVFLPGMASRAHLEQFAKFTALRAIRRLPKLRLNRPMMRQRLTIPAPNLPNEDVIDASLRVVAFDGGIGAGDFNRWCTEQVPDTLAQTHADYLSHGAEVTSALIFGAVEPGVTELPRPFFRVTHHRVIGQNDESDPDLYDCMKRIDAVLKADDVDFANLSLGPRLAIDDGQPHAWTAMLDANLAKGKVFMTVAAGNDGDIAAPLGRIQPPADAVNALAVGSADSRDFMMWGRADYSCYGPGRAPGIVKPDGLAFGGTEESPLVLLSPFAGGLTGVHGTSFAAPLVLRTAASARVLSKTPLSATALRALLIHRAERFSGHNADDVGWGRFPVSADYLLTCEESEVRVLYQGKIAGGGIVRIGVPIPPVPLGVRFRITATFCFASPVDAADPVNYTRHGLTITFRPRGEGSSAPFFSTTGYGNEQDLRRDAYKWETVLHRSLDFGAEELLNACFDVEHGGRSHGLAINNRDVPDLPYVLIATVSSEKGEPIYQKVMQKYRALAPIELRQRIQVKKG